jgi:RNA polymerase primary sigma factor
VNTGVAEAQTISGANADVLDIEQGYEVSKASDPRASLERYMQQCKRHPLLTHSDLLEKSRKVYTEHHHRFSCVTQLPTAVKLLVDLHKYRRANNQKWTTYVISAGDLSPSAKDSVLAAGGVTPKKPSNRPLKDTTVTSDTATVAALLDDLCSAYDTFVSLPSSAQLQFSSPEIDSLSEQARSIEIQWGLFEEMCAHFVEVSDRFIQAKRSLVAAALGKPSEHSAVNNALEQLFVSHDELVSSLHEILPGPVDYDELNKRIRGPLARLRSLEAEYSRPCEVVIELRRHYNASLARQQCIANEIVMRNLLLVAHEVIKTKVSSNDVFDAIQEGNEGLAVAAYRFKYWAGTRFSTYAVFWIKNRLRRYRSASTNATAIPVSVENRCMNVYRSRERLTKQNGGISPTVHAVADDLGIDVQKVIEADCAYLPCESDDTISTMTAEDDSFDSIVQLEQLRSIIREAIATLPPKHALITRLRFGIDSPETYTLNDISGMCGLSHERVRHIEKESVEKLCEGRFGPVLAEYFSL